MPIDVRALGVDLLTIAGHKFYGPKGTGALWIKRGVRLISPITGGRQERNRRAGTENVPALVGFGVAAELATEKGDRRAAARGAARSSGSGHPRDRSAAPSATAPPSRASPNTTNISIDRVEAESFLIGLDLAGIAVSSGSACSSGTLEPSHVLKAMGLPHAADARLDPLQPRHGEYRRRHRSCHRGIAAVGGEAAQPDDCRRQK